MKILYTLDATIFLKSCSVQDKKKFLFLIQKWEQHGFESLRKTKDIKKFKQYGEFKLHELRFRKKRLFFTTFEGYIWFASGFSKSGQQTPVREIKKALYIINRIQNHEYNKSQST
jgi:hypothetical protein